MESKGWKVGTATDFLNLAPEEEAYVDLKRRLADGLKKRRMKTRLTQGELARVVRSSRSRVAKMEAGDPTVTLDLLIRSLLALGASIREVARIMSGSGEPPAA